MPAEEFHVHSSYRGPGDGVRHEVQRSLLDSFPGNCQIGHPQDHASFVSVLHFRGDPVRAPFLQWRSDGLHGIGVLCGRCQ